MNINRALLLRPLRYAHADRKRMADMESVRVVIHQRTCVYVDTSLTDTGDHS